MESIREMLDEANENIGELVAGQLPRNMLQPEGTHGSHCCMCIR